MSFEWFIARRYLTARRRQAFISLISTVSIVGVGVGVMAVIIALALMTGMQGELRDRIVGSEAHVYVYKLGAPFLEVDAELRTSVLNIFAAGDVIGSQHGSQMATPVGARQGVIAAHNALSPEPPRRFDGRVIPRAFFTDPPVGTVGMTEAEATAAGHRCWCRPLPMTLVPRAGATRSDRRRL